MSSSPCPFPLAAYPHVPEVGPRDHSARDDRCLRPPSGGGSRAIHSIGGSATCACKKAKLAASQRMQHLPWRSPGDRPQASGAFFSFESVYLLLMEQRITLVTLGVSDYGR